MPFLRNEYHKEQNLNYLRHSLEVSNLDQETYRLTENLVDALTTAVDVITFKEQIQLTKSNKTIKQTRSI